MIQICIIEGLLYNSKNDVKRIRTTSGCSKISMMFGDKAELICGEIVVNHTYLCTWEEPFHMKGGQTAVADFIVRDRDGLMIFGYEIQ